MTRRIAAAAAVTAAMLASPAPGAAPVVVGQGQKPDIAVDAAGRAHLAFVNTAPAIEEARYCQLPRGAAACVDAETFVGTQPADDDDIFGRAHVFVPSAGEVIVAHERCCGDPGEGMLSNRSTDGGLNFNARVFFGEMPVGASFDEAVYGPGASITALAEVVTAGTQVQNGPVAGPEQVPAADLSAINAEGAIGLDEAGRPVAVYQVQESSWRLAWRRLGDGHALTPANINDATRWTAEQTIEGDRISAADGPALAGGPNGLFLFWQKRLPDEGFVSKFTGSGWTAPVKITSGSFNAHDLFQDASGRLHAIWNAYADSELRYTWSDDGVSWAPVVDVARGESYQHVRLAAAGDHQGFAVWDRGGPDIAAVPLEALPEPPVDPGGPDTTAPTAGDLGIGDSTLLPGAGTVFTFTSSEAGNAVLTVQKRVKGLKVKKKGKKRCVPRTKKRLRKLRHSAGSVGAFRKLLRKRRCKAWRKVGEIRQSVTSGSNTIVFTGRIAGRRLAPGFYRALLKITDLAGNVSRTEVVRFRVLRPRRRR